MACWLYVSGWEPSVLVAEMDGMRALWMGSPRCSKAWLASPEIVGP